MDLIKSLIFRIISFVVYIDNTVSYLSIIL